MKERNTRSGKREDLSGDDGKNFLIERDGKMYVMPEGDVTERIISMDILNRNGVSSTEVSNDEWESTAALTIDIDSKRVEKSRFF